MDEKETELRDCLVTELRRGIDLINRLHDSVYVSKPGGTASVGEHFRHNLDFAANFLKGFETGEIDYETRERNTRVETERVYAVERFTEVIQALENLTIADLEKPLSIKSEVVDDLWQNSGALRELEFLHSHTVHHYALIVAKLSFLGVEFAIDFGVSPSTLKYWNSEKRKATAS